MGNFAYDSAEGVKQNRCVMVTDGRPVRYTDDGDEIKVAWLPKGAWVIDVLIDITEAFNDSGNDYIRVGINGTTEKYLADVSVASTGKIVGSQAGSPLVPNQRLTEDTWIVAVYNGANNNASTGKAVVSIMWAPCTEEDAL